MDRYVSMLRGINVGGNNKISMQVLKEVYASLKLEEVQTYIQSGNVAFSTTFSVPEVKTKIEKEIKKKFGFDVFAIIRSKKEIANIIKNSPYKPKDETKLYVVFLSRAPKQIPMEELNSAKSKDEEFSIAGREIYFSCPNGYGVTKLSNNFFERKLKVEATTRNWRTVNRLHKMLSTIDPPS